MVMTKGKEIVLDMDEKLTYSNVAVPVGFTDI